jgi:hypothetical protein
VELLISEALTSDILTFEEKYELLLKLKSPYIIEKLRYGDFNEIGYINGINIMLISLCNFGYII